MSQKKQKAVTQNGDLFEGVVKLYLLNSAVEKALTATSAAERLATGSSHERARR